MIDLTDRVVLVTGASGGIGSATARTIVACGGDVVLHDVRPGGRLAELADELGERAHAIAANLADPSGTAQLWAQALAWRGRLDALVNNAGIYEPTAIDDPLEQWTAAWDRMLAICLVAPATLCREAIKTFRQQHGGGTIVNLASRAAWRGEDPDYWHYAAAKAGIVAMTKTIARQYGRDGVVAYGVAPGFVNTPFNDALVEQHGLEMFADDTGLGEVAGPQDLANVIVFLTSGLARHATGTTVDVNGASYVR
jgi:NAD(P)-dependent dehydrogenase (short-subunit alcohol dehydrogenase family)